MAGLGNVYRAFCCIATGGLLFGYIIGISSNVVTTGQLLCKDNWTGDVGGWFSNGYHQCYKLSPLNQGILTSLNLIGATISSLICFKYGDILGRKREVQIAACLYVVGSVVAAASPALWGIYLGFLLYGVGIGFAMHAAPVYIAEMSPAEVRGRLVSAKEGVIVVGMCLGFLAGFIFSFTDEFGWRFMVASSALLATAMGLGMFLIPNSPRWLVLRSCREAAQAELLGHGGGLSEAFLQEALEALQFFRGTNSAKDVEEELSAMRADAAASVGAAPAGCADAFRYPRPLVVGCGLVFLQQVTGQPSVLYFATNIFKDAGFASSFASLSSVIVSVAKLVATLFAVLYVDKFGRRSLLKVGIAMMSVALLVLGIAFFFRAGNPPELPREWGVATVVALMFYVSGYQVGFGPISWLMISEIFPLSVRGAALSIAAVVNFTSNIGMTICQAPLQDSISPGGLFLVYLGMCFVSFAFVQCVVPETKGKTLEEIEREMTGRRDAREVLQGA